MTREQTLYGGAAAARQTDGDRSGKGATGDPALTLYGDPATALQTAKATTEVDRATVLGQSAAERAASDAEYAKVVTDAGLAGTRLVDRIFRAKTDGELAAARGGGVDDAQIVAWNEEMRRELRDTYGAAEGETVLARTQAFVRKHPKLAAILRTNGLGSRPDIVRDLVEHVRAVDFRG